MSRRCRPVPNFSARTRELIEQARVETAEVPESMIVSMVDDPIGRAQDEINFRCLGHP